MVHEKHEGKNTILSPTALRLPKSLRGGHFGAELDALDMNVQRYRRIAISCGDHIPPLPHFIGQRIASL